MSEKTQSPAIPSVLGTDPVESPEETKPEVEQREDPKSEPETPDTSIRLTVEEIEELQRKAANFDTISSDPQLAPVIADHYRAKTGKVPTKKVDESDDTGQENSDPLDSIRQKIDARDRQLAELEVKLFVQQNPDAPQYASDIQKFAEKGFSLEEAYQYAKAIAKPQVPATEKKVTVQPTSETDSGEMDSPNFTNDALAKISDPKATPRIEDAFDLAYKLAKQQTSDSEE